MGNSEITFGRILKCAISLIVFTMSFLVDCLFRLLRRRPKGTCVVLYYHSVPSGQRSQFANQLESVLRWTKPLPIGSNVQLLPGVRHSAITFDDAFENFVDVALPELHKRNICSTMFVIPDALGKTFGQAGCAERVMSQQQLLNLPEALVTVGSHTLTHPMLTQIEEARAREEIVNSRSKLEQILNRKVAVFSFPFGDFNDRLVGICREAGYKYVFTTLPGFAFSRGDEFVVGRVRVDPTDWSLEFLLKLAGAYRWLPLAFSIKRSILFAMRGASGSPTGKKVSVSPQSMIRETSNQ
jgi:peptidoglycan/xylan/chitin deacetylase (PgdA/CDA1 family)